MNKLLILSVLQLGMFCAILYVLLDKDSELQTQESERPSIGPAETVQEVRSDAVAATVDAEAIRQIVRSELFAFAVQFSVLATGPEADASNFDPLEREARLDIHHPELPCRCTRCSANVAFDGTKPWEI